MNDTSRLSRVLGKFRDWIDTKGNLQPSQMRKTFRTALIIGAEYILRVHGLAKNPGLFPLSRMHVALLMGLDEAVVKRCIPVWRSAGLIRQMSVLTRRGDDFLGLFPKNPDREPFDVHYCPHQYLLGEAYEAIFGLENGTRCELPPSENRSGQEKLNIVRDSIIDDGAHPEPDLSRWIPGVSVRFPEDEPEETPPLASNIPAMDDPLRRPDREPEFVPAPWDTFEPQSLTEAVKLLQAAVERLNAIPDTWDRRTQKLRESAQEAIRKAEGWVCLFEGLQMVVKPLSEEAMRSSNRLPPFRR